MSAHWTRAMLGGLLATALVLSGACSSDDSGSGSADDTGGDSSGIPEAADAVEELTVRPTEIVQTTPLDGEVPSGLTAAWLQCSIPDCEILGPPLEEALQEFGWSMDTIDAGITPEEVKSGWGLAAEQNPDAVFATGFPTSIYSDELAQLAASDTPVIQGFIAETAGNGVSAVIAGTSTSEAIGEAFANWVLAERGEDANVLLVHSSTFPTLVDVRNGFESRYSELCADCEVEVLDVPAESFGADLPAEVVAKLQSNPEINYVVADEGNMLLGLPQAMETAGITDVPVIGQYPSETSIEYLTDGSIVKAIVMPRMTDAMWAMTDAMARTFTGQSVEEDESAGPLWIVTPETAGELEVPYHLVEGYQEQYGELWSGVTGG